MILFILFIYRLVFAECYPVEIVQNKSYTFKCNDEIVSQHCGLIKGICEVDLNEKLKKYNLIFNNNILQSINSFNTKNAETLMCAKGESNLQCVMENNCGNNSVLTISKLISLAEEIDGIKLDNSNCFDHLPPLDRDNVKLFSHFSCKEALEKYGIVNVASSIKRECPQIELAGVNDTECKISKLIKTLKTNPLQDKLKNIFQKECEANNLFFADDDLRSMNSNFGDYLAQYFSKGLSQCSQMKLDQKSLDQLICYKAEEYKSIKFLDSNSKLKNCGRGYFFGAPITTSTVADKDKPVDSRKIAGQPDKADFTLPTESPSIKNQETLQKIDKLIADNGGEVTPEIAKQAGAIFNSGIYQPTKNFINSVEKAISDRVGSSSSSGSSSSRYRANKNDKAYEIGSKTSGARTVANITEEAPSAARATAINGKISAAPGSSASAENDVGNRQSNNKEFATSNKQNDKLSSNIFSAASGSASGPQGAASVGGSSPNLASASSGARGEELPQLPSLSAADKSEITKVVQALKGAESSEDVKSIVTGEDNYAQVKRIIQELEQSKKGTTQNQEINNARNPASVQSGEVKDFEKTLEKFGIKVYGEAGPGKAVYAPQTVNHVIVLKNNSVQFLNTIRSKK